MPISVGAEVQQLPLAFVLSAPLTAAIEAQALSAQNTIEFVNTLGADEFGDLRVMTFNYETNVTDPVTGDPATREVVLTVPVLSMVEAPHIAIEDLSVGFEFTIREVLSRENELKLAGSWSSDTAINNTTDVNVSSSTSGLMKFLYGERSTTVNSNTSISIKNSMSVSAAYRTSSKEDVERRATLKLNMTAKQRVPEGFQRVLTIFADAISAQAEPKPAGPGE